MNILILIIVGVAGIGFGVYFASRDSVEGLVLEQSKKKGENKQKILKFLRESGKVTNNDVEKLIKVSDSTATRYLDDLEKDGKVEQIGETGNAVYYILK